MFICYPCVLIFIVIVIFLGKINCKLSVRLFNKKTLNDYIKSLNIVRSFSRPYVPYDNSVVESFFASMKRENLYRTRYRSEREFRAGVDYYINYYNIKRRHETLNYISPQKYEERYATATTDNGVA